MFSGLNQHSPKFLAVLRIVTAILFVEAGSVHLFGPPFSIHPPPPEEMQTLLFTAGLLEFVGGLLLLVGFLTRPVAFVLSGLMAVAYWGFHFPMNPFPSNNMGVAAILYCFVFLYLFAAGPGAWALDNVRRRHAQA